MPLASRIRDSLVVHFAAPASRFKVALVAGFLISAAGFTTVVVGDRDGIAQEIWGLGDMFGAHLAAPQQVAPQQPSEASSGGGASRRHHREASRSRAAPARFLRAVEREDRREGRRSYAEGRPIELGRKSMCVRLCDGFAFPVGTYHGSEDRASHEATCHAECPGAETALYVVPSGSDSIEDAVRVGTDKNYLELPYAFHYTSTLSQACTCHAASGNRVKSLLRDFTLRRGDAVMTPKGFKIFHGGGHFPYRRSDFLTLADSRDIGRGNRATFHEIERASLMSSPNVVAQATSKPAWKPLPLPLGASKEATRGLEHQARLSPPAPPKQP